MKHGKAFVVAIALSAGAMTLAGCAAPRAAGQIANSLVRTTGKAANGVVKTTGKAANGVAKGVGKTARVITSPVRRSQPKRPGSNRIR